MKEGDRCTKFFHQVANSNRRVNTISSSEVDGVLVEDSEVVSTKIVQFYESLYQESYDWRPLDGLAFDNISDVEAEWMERPFDEAEVSRVVRTFNGGKALGPDGFSLAFFQSCWEVVKGDVLAMFNEFAQQGKFVRSINATYIVLIPKKVGAVELKGLSSYKPCGRGVEDSC